MTLEKREKSPRERPVGVSKKTLQALGENAKNLHWYSIRDRSLRDVFKRSGEMGLPGFNKESWFEVRRVVLAFEENQRKREDEIPKQELSLELKESVRIGNQYRPQIPIRFPPIFNPFARSVITLMVANRYHEIPKYMTDEQREILRDNLYVMKILYGFTPRS